VRCRSCCSFDVWAVRGRAALTDLKCVCWSKISIPCTRPNSAPRTCRRCGSGSRLSPGRETVYNWYPPMITLWTHKGYAAPIGEHVMPRGKFRLRDEMTAELRGFEHKKPEPADDEALLRVHTEHYIEAIRTGHPRPLAES